MSDLSCICVRVREVNRIFLLVMNSCNGGKLYIHCLGGRYHDFLLKGQEPSCSCIQIEIVKNAFGLVLDSC